MGGAESGWLRTRGDTRDDLKRRRGRRQQRKCLTEYESGVQSKAGNVGSCKNQRLSQLKTEKKKKYPKEFASSERMCDSTCRADVTLVGFQSRLCSCQLDENLWGKKKSESDSTAEPTQLTGLIDIV